MESRPAMDQGEKWACYGLQDRECSMLHQVMSECVVLKASACSLKLPNYITSALNGEHCKTSFFTVWKNSLLHAEHLTQESQLSCVWIKIQDITEEIWRKDERPSRYIIYMEINWLNASESRNVAYANQPMQPFISQCRFISHARWHPITHLINTSFSRISLLKLSAMHVTCRRTLRNQLQNICREKVVFAKNKIEKKKSPLNKLSRLKPSSWETFLTRDISSNQSKSISGVLIRPCLCGQITHRSTSSSKRVFPISSLCY